MKRIVYGNPRTLLWLLLASLVINPVSVFSKEDHSQRRDNQMLSLVGEIVSVKVQARGSDLIYGLRLRLEFVNKGPAPIILLRGQYKEREEEWWILSTRLAHTSEDLTLNRLFYNSAVRPANSGPSSEWKNLRRRLDRKFPPKEETYEILPEQKLAFYADTFVVVSPTDQKTSNSTRFLDVTFEMWPLNIEQDSSKFTFGKKLRDRWRNRGVLWLDAVTSAPIALELSN